MQFGSMTLQEAVSLIDLLGGRDAVKKVLEGREFSPAKYGEMTFGRLEAIINKLGGIEGAKRFLRGEIELVDINIEKQIIDCDADPFVPEGWEVVEHRGNGKLEWDPAKFELYLCDEQEHGRIAGHELREKLVEGKQTLNANVLDYLLKHSELIPKEWKKKLIFFWGTIYRDHYGLLVVRCINWNRGKYGWGWIWFDDHIGTHSHYLVLHR